MAMKPIQTYYKGCHFRSRLEARWAVFFDALGIAWEFEHEGFILGDGTRYLPDFWLPKFNNGIWVEVKPTNEGFEKAYKFARSGGTILLADGTPACKPYVCLDPTVYGIEKTAMEYECCFLDKYSTNRVGSEHRLFWQPGSDEHEARYNPFVAAAVIAARSARFDRGQT